MPRPSLALVAGALMLLGACKAETAELGLACEADAAATVTRSSAIAYGVDIPAPQVEGVHPLKESDLFAVEMGDPEKLGLLASDATGAFHHVVCKDALCTVDEASALLAMCRNERQCKIVGAVREKTFFPLYLSNSDGGHVCSPRWG